MRIISFIKAPSVIRDILNHLGLWLARARPPPKAHVPPIREYAAVDLQLQAHADTIYGDPEYSWDAYIHAERLIKKGAQEGLSGLRPKRHS